MLHHVSIDAWLWFAVFALIASTGLLAAHAPF